MERPAPQTDRVVGGILGLALGDALGAPFEFHRARDIPDPIPAFEHAWGDLPPGSTTDDTAMARNLVRSLVACGGFDPDDLIARHLEWYRTRPPDIGNLTRRVLSAVASGEDAATAASAEWERRGPEVSAGNGSVMYVAPLGFAFARLPHDRIRSTADALSGLTHHDGRCRMAAAAIAQVAADLALGVSPEAAVSVALAEVEGSPGGEELAFLVEAIAASRSVDGPDQGFALYAAAIGLQTVLRDEGVESGLRRVVALGGDADTNAAVAGALLGARDGLGGLPQHWLDRLVDREAIASEAEALAVLADSLGGTGD